MTAWWRKTQNHCEPHGKIVAISDSLVADSLDVTFAIPFRQIVDQVSLGLFPRFGWAR